MLSIKTSRLAFERNREVVPRTRYAATLLEDGDRIEIVTLVGGG
jgi:sulfur carrier protein